MTTAPSPPLPPMTTSLDRLLRQAAVINDVAPDQYRVTFAALLGAYLIGEGPTAVWFQAYAQTVPNAVDSILSVLGQPTGAVTTLAQRPPSSTPVTPDMVSESVHELLAQAVTLHERVREGRDDQLHVRHVMGAYIYEPGAAHRPQLTAWGLLGEPWSQAFLRYLAGPFAETVELDRWKQKHREAYSTDPPDDGAPDDSSASAAGAPSDAGLAGHLAHDLWTHDDTLGYRAYSHALYRFLVDPRTQAPLTIAIQAPWGGGKTSLMRMVQQKLDPVEAQLSRDGGNLHQRESLKTSEVLDVLKAAPNAAQRSDSDAVTAAGVAIDATSVVTSVPVIPGSDDRRFTVWFNAWKYQSSEQIWAGLADAIVHQVIDRMGGVEAAKFLYRLHRRRASDADLRGEILARVAKSAWQRVWRAAPWLLLVVIVSLVAGTIGLVQFGWPRWVPSLAAVIPLLPAAALWFRARMAAEQHTIARTLGSYLEVPRYTSTQSFASIHEDLQRVFDVLPSQFRPMVIFIDDLDRCSADKVAAVMEAVNAFLAGELEHCLFVLGMDPELVAAALESAYSPIVDKLPPYARHPSLGWRFMNKFIQLPVVLPAAETADLTGFTLGLLAEEARRAGTTTGADGQSAAGGAAGGGQETTANSTAGQAQPNGAPQGVESDAATGNTPAAAVPIDWGAVEKVLDAAFTRYSEQDEQVRRVILEGAAYFAGNPREIKRFLNAFRLQFHLRVARQHRGLPVASLEQMQRWTVLTLRWPDAAHWVQQGRAAGSTGVASRLSALALAAGAAVEGEGWESRLRTQHRFDLSASSWTADRECELFFRLEAARQTDPEPLSACSGKGFW